ncbi:MAG TPA: flagellar biosynthesis protein FlhA, partial [Chromatiaceae bacterium]|nr:flagellar biosynthesis protein FlhA [Chromatiaceae bacterium]
VYPDRELAINPGKVFGDLQGIATRDPAFGLEAVWIESGQREHAQALGYTIVDASTVVATHLSELVQRHAAELLGHEEVQQLIESLEKVAPKLVEDLTPKTLSLSVILKVLQNLLLEQVPIRDMRTIAETLAEHGAISQDPAALTAAVRVALSRGIIQQLVGSKEEIPVIVLEQELERLLQQSLMSSGEDGGVFEPGLAERLQNNLREAALQQEREGNEVIVLVVAGVRAWLARFMRHSGIDGHALSYNEIPDNRRVKVVATIGPQEQA